MDTSLMLMRRGMIGVSCLLKRAGAGPRLRLCRVFQRPMVPLLCRFLRMFPQFFFCKICKGVSLPAKRLGLDRGKVGLDWGQRRPSGLWCGCWGWLICCGRGIGNLLLCISALDLLKDCLVLIGCRPCAAFSSSG